MTRPTLRPALAAVVLLLSAATVAAHITPPVVLVSDRDALVGLLSGARRFFVREVRLSPQERSAIKAQTGWMPEDDLYRFYIGRDAEGRLVAASTFVTEYTVHGPVRVAVALGPDGRVRGATVVELTEETYTWVKPLLDRDFTRQFVGQPTSARFAAPESGLTEMPRFYGQVIASLVQRAAVLFDVGVLKRGEAA
ncbi:MAG: hypothetical protein ACREM3_22365 [Candidatus Rokuibacteriota bacterium]